MAEGSSSEIRLPGWKSGPHHILFIVIWVCPWGSLRLSFFIHTMEIRNTRQYNEINIKMLSTGSRQSQCSTCCSVAKLCPALWDSMDHSVSGFPVLHYLLEFAQTHVHLILCHPLLFLPSILPSIKVFSSELALHQVAEVLEFQLQHQSFQWIFQVDFL